MPEEFERADLLTSPLARAVETARIVGRREPLVTPELIEMDWGDWEGRHGVDLLADTRSGYRHIEEWGWNFEPPGGETPGDVWQRLKPWISSIRGQAVLVSHIGVMRVLLARATGWNFEGPPPFRVKRERLYRIDVHDDQTLSHDGAPVRLIPISST